MAVVVSSAFGKSLSISSAFPWANSMHGLRHAMSAPRNHDSQRRDGILRFLVRGFSNLENPKDPAVP